jgi:hypothetical protein
VEEKSQCTRTCPFSEFEQIKGEMALKTWENNLEESKRLAKEEKDACLDALLAVDLEMAEIDVSGIHATLGQVEIEKNKEDLKKSRERVQNAILQVNHVDLQILNDLLVKPSLQHQITQQAVVKIQRNLPLVHKKVFSFELNANIEPSKFVIALLDLHAQFKDQQNPSAPTRK